MPAPNRTSIWSASWRGSRSAGRCRGPAARPSFRTARLGLVEGAGRPDPAWSRQHVAVVLDRERCRRSRRSRRPGSRSAGSSPSWWRSTTSPGGISGSAVPQADSVTAASAPSRERRPGHRGGSRHTAHPAASSALRSRHSRADCGACRSPAQSSTRRPSVVRRHFPATPQLEWPLLSEHVGAQVWVKHENATPTGAFKVRGGLVYADRASRERPARQGLRLRHARQPRTVPRVCRAGGRAARRDRGAGGEQPGQERRHARLRRGAGRARPRLPGGPRARHGTGGRARARGRAAVPPRPRRGRRHLRPRAVRRGRAARHRLRAGRHGVGDLRPDRGA